MWASGAAARMRGSAARPSRSAVCIGTEMPMRRARAQAASTSSSSGRTARSKATAASPARSRNPATWAIPSGGRPSSYMERRTMSPRPGNLASLRGGRTVIGRELGALAEEELLRLVEEDLLPALGREVESVLIHDHLRVLEPELPRFLRDVVVDLLAELVVEGLVDDTRQLLAELGAVDHPAHVSSSRRLSCRR